jgi:hypothetical protein
MRNTVSILAASLILTASAGLAASSGPALTGEQFKAAIVGQKLKWVSADTGNFTITAFDTYNADGSVTGTWSTGKSSGDIAPASWMLKGNMVCVTQSPKNGGKTACHTWHKVDDASYSEMNSNGSLHGTNAVLK